MKLTANSSPVAQFVGLRNNPSNRAFSDTSIVLAAYLEALSSLLAVCSQDPDSKNVVRGMYQNCGRNVRSNRGKVVNMTRKRLSEYMSEIEKELG